MSDQNSVVRSLNYVNCPSDEIDSSCNLSDNNDIILRESEIVRTTEKVKENVTSANTNSSECRMPLLQHEDSVHISQQT